MMHYCVECKTKQGQFIHFESPPELASYTLCSDCANSLRSVLTKSTPHARVLYFTLRASNIPAELEYSDGFKSVDIALLKKNIPFLYIEVDGSHHKTDPDQGLTDLKRTVYSLKENIPTIPIPNKVIATKLKEVVQQFYDSYQELSKASIKKKKYNTFFDWLDEEDSDNQGYCIRCGDDKVFDYDRPYCRDCWEEWDEEGADEYEEEPFCHVCGKEKNNICKEDPICKKCTKKGY